MANVQCMDAKDLKRLEVHKQTRLCKFFAVGACTRGSKCAFAHGQEKLRDQPDFSKTRLCADFVELGRCSEGRNCKFAHGRHELKPGSAAKVARRRPEVTEVRATRATRQTAWEVPKEAAREVVRVHHVHEQAALKLMMQAVKPKAKEDEDNCFDLNGIESFSRQTTWEGLETLNAFSRGSSMESETVELAELPKVHELPQVHIQIKNTFVDFSEDMESKSLRRTRSLPLF